MKLNVFIKKTMICFGIFTFVLMLFTLPVSAEDMRVVSLKAKKDYQKAVEEKNKTRAMIKNSKAELENKIAAIEKYNRRLKKEIKKGEARFEMLKKEEVELAGKKSADESNLKELSGAVRVAAKNLEGMLRQSIITAENPERVKQLSPVLDKKRFPGIDDMGVVSDLYFDEMEKTGAVNLRKGTFVDRNGEKSEAELLTIGPFTGAYHTEKETGLLSYSEKSFELYALSALPPWGMKNNLKKYIKGKSDKVVIDISKGAALRKITNRPGVVDRIKQGGPLVWPILLIGLFAGVIGIERGFFLKGVHANTDSVMGEVNRLAGIGKWEECDKIVSKRKNRPVNNVLRAGLAAKNEDRETLESILQEAILKELPQLEKYLPMLNMMGSVSPLIGLLGTVTGMISTFHVITLYGTGDPRMMSGGISTALVTTMLGLAVAIPVMLLHTFLNGRVEHIIGDMEEKAIAMTNIINREQLAG